MSNSTNCEPTVLDSKVALVSVSIGVFSGYRRVTREQIEELGGNLPNCQAVTEGSIKVFPNEALTDVLTIRRRVLRELGAMSIKALDSATVRAIPRAELARAEAIVEAGQTDFRNKVAALDQQYDAICAKHIQDNQDAAAIIRSNMVPKDVAMAKMRFKARYFSIVPVAREGESTEKGVQEIMDGLGRQLFEEVAAEMAELAKNDAFTKNNRAGQKTLRPIKAVIAKMKGFAFLDTSVDGAIALAELTLNGLPKTGFIEGEGDGQAFRTLRRLVDVMADVDELVNAAGKVANGLSVEQVLFPAPVMQLPVASPVVAPVASCTPVVRGDVPVSVGASAILPARGLPRLPTTRLPAIRASNVPVSLF